MNKKTLIKLLYCYFLILLVMHAGNVQADWSPMETGTTNWFAGVWGSSATDVYAVGSRGSFFHYNGFRWNSMNVVAEEMDFTAVWGSSASDVYVISAEGSIIHYDGSTWDPLNMERWLRDVWGSSPNDVFVVGSNVKSPIRALKPPLILHYDGSTWTEMKSATTEGLVSVWGSSESDVFTVGAKGTIQHYDGSVWTEMESGTEDSLYGVWGSSESDVFAVGTNGTILHYDGTNWSAMDSGITYDLLEVWGTSSSDVFASGWGGGTIHHYDGSTWSQIEIVLVEDDRPFYGIWGSSENNIFVVGSYGNIFHYTTGPCIIASIYGDDSDEVKLLRRFRDGILSKTPQGKKMIKLYYEWNPLLIEPMKGNETLKKQLREITDEVLSLFREG